MGAQAVDDDTSTPETLYDHQQTSWCLLRLGNDKTRPQRECLRLWLIGAAEQAVADGELLDLI
jgi:hypothetical protein